jgi:alpha-1,3-rhamnosyl/mannosyltransferase
VSTIHDVIFLAHPELFPARNLAASRWALDRQIRDSDTLICVSAFTRKEVLERTNADPDRVRVIPLAVAVRSTDEETAVALRAAHGIDRPYVLYIGSLEPRKDVPTLLSAWVASKASSEFALVLAGAPAYLAESTLAALDRASTRADIRVLGYVSENSKAALLDGAKAFVYPSIYEGFGIPVLEAMHFGLPVIACQTSSIPEVLGSSGLLVPAADPDAMREAIDTLLESDETQARFAAAGRDRAKQFTWARVAEETAAAYEQASSRI